VNTTPAALVSVATRVDAELRTVLDDERAAWRGLDSALDEPLADLDDLIMAGGKRIRPAYCFWGWVMGGGDPADAAAPGPQPWIGGACALELLHAFALAHDDVMDGSPTRRGAPTVWARFIDRHRDRSWRGEDRRFGEAAAILVGDMAMVMADRALGPVGPEVRSVWDRLRTELNMGQYLDVVGTVSGEVTHDAARTIVRHKTAGYTVVRPLQLGAALAGRPDLADELAAHGIPLGTAFQLRDDVLGAFGDPARTGKPVGDDLREGKPTVMLARAIDAADPAQAAVLARVGTEMSDDDIAAIQEVLVDTGARAAVETEIVELLGEATAALDALPDREGSRAAMESLAEFVVERAH